MILKARRDRYLAVLCEAAGLAKLLDELIHIVRFESFREVVKELPFAGSGEPRGPFFLRARSHCAGSVLRFVKGFVQGVVRGFGVLLWDLIEGFA